VGRFNQPATSCSLIVIPRSGDAGYSWRIFLLRQNLGGNKSVMRCCRPSQPWLRQNSDRPGNIARKKRACQQPIFVEKSFPKNSSPKIKVGGFCLKNTLRQLPLDINEMQKTETSVTTGNAQSRSALLCRLIVSASIALLPGPLFRPSCHDRFPGNLSSLFGA
jgi:hypothetical protein